MKPLYQVIADEIRNKIKLGEYHDGMLLPKEIELVKEYDVSRITIQQAMKILVSEDIIYRVSGKGSYVGKIKKEHVRKSDAPLIGVILCNISASYGLEMFKAIEKTAYENGCNIVFKNSWYDQKIETDAIRALIDLKADGIIVQPVHGESFNQEFLKLFISGYPIVLLDRYLKGLQLPFVGSNNTLAVDNVMEFLFKKGHTNICLFTPVYSDTSTIEERVFAFNAAYVAHNLSNGPANLFTDIVSPLKNTTSEDAIARDINAIATHLLANPQISCAFASEYAVSRMIRTAASKINRKIPDNLSLITFDNHNDIYRKNMTTFVRQNQQGIGEKVVRIILDLIRGEKITDKFYFEAEIVDNGSVLDF